MGNEKWPVVNSQKPICPRCGGKLEKTNPKRNAPLFCANCEKIMAVPIKMEKEK